MPGAKDIRELLSWLDGADAQPESETPTAPATSKSKDEPVYADMVNLQSRPELNGKRVEVLRYVTDKDRYAVRLQEGDGAKETKTLMLKPESLVLVPGSAVHIVGLVGAKELNLRLGVVQDFVAETGRYTVRMAGEANLKRIKAVSCRAGPTPSAPTREAKESDARQ